MPNPPQQTITIHYRRLPDREQIFHQRLVADDGECMVTLLERAELPRPVRVGEVEVLQPGAPVVWFTFRDRWHDIGRFHRADGTFTGIYANVLTPVEVTGDHWRTTDLFLDLWLGADGGRELLDQDEFDQAIRQGWLDTPTADRARAEALDLLRQAEAGSWPPPVVSHWTLERVRDQLRSANPRDR